MISPNEFGISIKMPEPHEKFIQKYTDLKEFYCDSMTATRINLAHDSARGNSQVAVKTIYKNLLFGDVVKKQAAIEFPIQCSLNHENLVKGYEYSENDNEYIGVLEYVNKPEYLKEKIDDDLSQIKSEIKIKSFMYDLFEGIDY